MSDIAKVTVSESDDVFENPHGAAHICFDMDTEDEREHNLLLSLATFFCEKGFYVYVSYSDDTTLNISEAYRVMKEFEKRHPDVE